MREHDEIGQLAGGQRVLDVLFGVSQAFPKARARSPSSRARSSSGGRRSTVPRRPSTPSLTPPTRSHSSAWSCAAGRASTRAPVASRFCGAQPERPLENRRLEPGRAFDDARDVSEPAPYGGSTPHSGTVTALSARTFIGGERWDESLTFDHCPLPGLCRLKRRASTLIAQPRFPGSPPRAD